MLTLISIIIFSITVLIYSSDLLIDSSIKVAKKYNISSVLIGVIIISLGTSIPELSTSISSQLMKAPEIVITNIIGSNIFNICIAGSLVLILASCVNNLNKVDIIFLLTTHIIFTLLVITNNYIQVYT